MVQSGESLPGGPLSGKAQLGEPFRGEVCHPGMPILQVALVTLALISAALLTRGPSIVTASGDSGEGPGGQRMVVQLDPSASGGSVVSLEARLVELKEASAEGVIGLTSPGFWEGVGHVSFVQTECGECFLRRPPRRTPYKGERAVIHVVNPDTFSLAGIVVLEGRAFTEEDSPEAELVAVVSRAFAEEHFQDGEAIGRRVRIGSSRWIWHTVVGVVEPLRRNTLVARQQPTQDVFLPMAQVPLTDLEIVGTELDALVAESSDLGFTVREIGSLDERPLALERWIQWYGGLWQWSGLAGLLLAVVGVVLTVSRRVREQAQETALRRAVGARWGRLIGHHLGFGIQVGVLGSALGCWLALFSMASILPEGFGLLGDLGPLFLAPALVLAATAGVVAASSAYLNILRTPMT